MRRALAPRIPTRAGADGEGGLGGSGSCCGTAVESEILASLAAAAAAAAAAVAPDPVSAPTARAVAPAPPAPAPAPAAPASAATAAAASPAPSADDPSPPVAATLAPCLVLLLAVVAAAPLVFLTPPTAAECRWNMPITMPCTRDAMIPLLAGCFSCAECAGVRSVRCGALRCVAARCDGEEKGRA